MSIIESSFDSALSELDELRTVIFGDLKAFNHMKKTQELLASDPAIRFHYSEYDMTRDEAFQKNIARTVRIKEFIRENGIEDICYLNYYLYGYWGNQMISTSLHHGMFEPMIRILGSEEQVNEYLDDILNYRILGCYAQTEVGHGSDVQNLQTEAVLDEMTDEFVINTPDIKAAKFWPGELGKMATHAVFHAKLIIKGESYGIHAFITQIRNNETHIPLKGLEIGDIGPKYGFSSKDNGYMIFKDFRIPRTALLSKYVSWSKDGVLSINGDPKVAYSTMMLIRVMLLNLGWDLLLKWLMITVNYTSFRKQFKSLPGSDEERRIIDYQATQLKIAPCLAFGYANLFVGKRLLGMIHKMEKEIKTDKFHTMKELHALGSALKAYFMQETLDWFFTARELWGANGLSAYSNFPLLVELWSPNVTLEGDAMVMYLQTAKAIFKVIKKVQRGDKIFGTFSYLEEINNFNSNLKIDDVYSIKFLTDVIKVSALYQISKTFSYLNNDNGISWSEKWNKKYQTEIVRAVKLHSIYTTALIFYQEIDLLNVTQKLKEKLIILWKIYACDSILRYCDGALLWGVIQSEHLMKIKDMIESLSFSITSSMSLLTEASSVSDKIVHSIVSNMNYWVFTIYYLFTKFYNNTLINFKCNRKINELDSL